MDKYQMYDAIQKYKNNLSHMQSPLCGKQNQNVKYYKRIGKPGSYRYFYTKAEYDAYLNSNQKTVKKSGGMSQGSSEGDAYGKWLKEQAEKKKASNQSGSAKKAESEGDAYGKWLKDQEIKKQSASQSGSAKKAESEGNAYQEYLDKKKADEEQEQRFKQQSANQAGTFYKAESEGKAQQEYLNEKKAEREQWIKDHPYDVALQKINNYEGENFWENYREALLDVPEFQRLVNKAKRYVNANYEEVLKKCKEEGTRPEIILPMDATKTIETEIQEVNKKFSEAGVGRSYQELDSILYEYVLDLMSGKEQVPDYGLKNRDLDILKSTDKLKNSMKDEKNQEIVNEDWNELKNVITQFNDADFTHTNYWNNDPEFLKEKMKMKESLDSLLKEMRQNEKVDEKTGLPLKGYECSIEEDMALINYPRQLRIDDEGYLANCAMCTTAMILRQKGYDVSANNTNDAKEGYNWHDRFTKQFIGAETYWSQDPYDAESFASKMSEEPIGSYGDLYVAWNNCEFAHSVFYRVEEDGVWIYDGQSNDRIKLEDELSISHSWGYTRCDNLELNDYVIKTNNWTKFY